MQNEQGYSFQVLAAALEEATATIRSRTDELSLVRRVGDAISSLTSAPELCGELVEAIGAAVQCSHVAVFSGPSGSPFELYAVSSPFGSSDGFPKSLAAAGIAATLGKFQAPLTIQDFRTNSKSQRDWPFPDALLSFLFVPLIEGQTMRGVLCLADDRPGAFDESVLRTMMMVVPQIASSLARIGLYENARAAAVKYRTLVENMHDLVFICDSWWRIADVNSASQALFGESLTGRTLTELFVSESCAQEFSEKIQASGFVENFEAELTTRSGEKLSTLISCTDQGGQYSGVIKDMTERNRLVEQVARAQKMESIGTLAAGIAHDFNNVLGIIMPNAELIQLNSEEESENFKFADVIINASKRAHGLTRQLLSFGRNNPRKVCTININDVIRTTTRLFEQSIGKSIRIDLLFGDEIAQIKADESQMEQVLLNLAINARDAMPKGGVLEFRTSSGKEGTVVRVKDSGSGIPADLLPKIFDPFFTTKDKSKGSGLGLSVVYNLVKQLGGSIDVASEPGSGTEFILTFPSIAGPSAGAAPAATGRKPAKNAGRVLVVDDEPEIRELLQTVLTGMGCQVVCAANGLEALEKITGDTRLVMTDMMMPVMDGFTAIHAIRGRFPHVKIVMASGYINPDKLAALRTFGIDGFIQKPFELKKLDRIIRDVLDGPSV